MVVCGFALLATSHTTPGDTHHQPNSPDISTSG
jgi:hypothetical protein